MEQVYWALEKTKLISFVKEQPQGLNTILYPEGKQIPFTVGKKLVLTEYPPQTKTFVAEGSAGPF